MVLLPNNLYIHLPFTVHTCACQIYATTMCMRLKHALHFILILISGQDNGAVKLLRRINYLTQEGLLATVTRPGKTGLIYTKYTCSNYDTYLLFCIRYPKSVSFIKFLMDFFMYDDIVDTILITDKKLLHFTLKIR